MVPFILGIRFKNKFHLFIRIFRFIAQIEFFILVHLGSFSEYLLQIIILFISTLFILFISFTIPTFFFIIFITTFLQSKKYGLAHSLLKSCLCFFMQRSFKLDNATLQSNSHLIQSSNFHLILPPIPGLHIHFLHYPYCHSHQTTSPFLLRPKFERLSKWQRKKPTVVQQSFVNMTTVKYINKKISEQLQS